jgi:hypothetical protein
MLRRLKQKIDAWMGKEPRIQIFVRHCYTSDASQHKARFTGFSRERCYQNLVQTLDGEAADVTFFLDTARAPTPEHFLKEQKRFPVIEIHAGTEGASFLAMFDYALAQKIDSEAIVYFLEDDYLHQPGWLTILREGFSLPAIDYVTLYDHKDKYFAPEYQDLQAHIFHTRSCHWRTTPSTTNTYAMRFKTLKRDASIHRAYSEGQTITKDHEKFMALAAQGACLISSIPGFATHAQPEFASPCADWQNLLDNVGK